MARSYRPVLVAPFVVVPVPLGAVDAVDPGFFDFGFGAGTCPETVTRDVPCSDTTATCTKSASSVDPTFVPALAVADVRR
ncbi:hypothetical protein GCM10025864_34610 [Luteimicrobium album]|uniref:Secreted protein n=1 Tax=Luteimicrobium album TaxID=1054550 RepID=A0ABQ6I5F8_9MICO|nr:hypothetical protein GCM10025864_34610 [Luteimicrobium album]